MERAANESISNIDNSDEGETSPSSSAAELEHQQSTSTQTHAVVCWNVHCPDCPSPPIAHITPWPRSASPPPSPRQQTPEDRRAAFALALLRGADPISSEEITRATGSRGSLVASNRRRTQIQRRPIGEQETLHRSSARERSCLWNAANTGFSGGFPALSHAWSSTPRPPPVRLNRSGFSPSALRLSTAGFANSFDHTPIPSMIGWYIDRSLSPTLDSARSRSLITGGFYGHRLLLADVVLRSAFPQWERWFVGVRDREKRYRKSGQFVSTS
jgi:hypothetical protein